MVILHRSKQNNQVKTKAFLVPKATRLIVAGIGYLSAQTMLQGMAKDLGVYGQTFEIAEQDLLEQIEAKLKRLQQDGSLSKIQTQQTEQARRSVQRPKEVVGITRADHARSWLHDPSLKIAKDIKDHKGRIIARAGTLINPLDTVPFRRPFVFIDSDDTQQMAWLKSSFDMTQDALKVILVKGAPLELSEDLKMPIYFDQGGALTRTFKIQAVPAVVRQEGKKLRIEEVCLEDRNLEVPQQNKQQAAADHQDEGPVGGIRGHNLIKPSEDVKGGS